MYIIRANRTCRMRLAAGFVLWVIITTLYVAWDAKPPFVDVFLFKEAGVNLATEGHFVAANLPHMPPETSLTYAYYAPVYPFTFGVWSSLLGVGLKQSILFDLIIKGLRTLAITMFIWPWLLPRLNYFEMKGIVAQASLLVISFLPYYTDRPDELGLVFGLFSWYLIRNSPIQEHMLFLSGILLGLCGATSPAAGILFALGGFLLIQRDQISIKRFLALAGFGLVSFAFCTAPALLIDPGAWHRFSQQLPESILPFQGLGHGLVGVKNFLLRWLETFWFSGKFALLPLLMFGAALATLWKSCEKTEAARFLLPLVQASVVFAPLATIFWFLQPRYLWFPCVVLFTVVLGLWLQKQPREGMEKKWWVAALLLIALGPGALFEGRSLFEAMELPESQSSRVIREKVLSYIEPEASLAVPADQFFTFRPMKEVAMAYYVCPWLDNYDYVYMTPRQDQRSGNGMLTPPCRRAQTNRCFVPVQDLRESIDITFLGYHIPYKIQGNGGVLFKNTHCLGLSNETPSIHG